MVTKFLSPPGQRDLSQIRKGICPVPLPPYRRKVYVPLPTSKQNLHLGPFLCFLAIKTDQQHMFGLDSPGLLGSRPALLAATLPSNKFYLLYILPCVWKFFSNPRLDHDKRDSSMCKFGEKVNGFRLRILSFVEEREETPEACTAIILL